MDVRFNVVRFRNEDVIATSFCGHVGATHWIADGTATYGANGEVYVGGSAAIYNGNGSFTPITLGEGTTFDLPAGSAVPAANTYYYVDPTSGKWTLCQMQPHR